MSRVSEIAKFAMVAVVAAVSASATAGAVVALTPPTLRAARAEAPMLLDVSAPVPHPGTAVPRGADGPYWAQGQVNGQPVKFLVDTGATAVALTPADAERLGFRIKDLKYGYRVVTAGGQARAASVTLSSVSVAGARLDDVSALVIEKGLDTSLLGMSYLGRLSRFEATPHALVLQP